jgi:hypothetical protein
MSKHLVDMLSERMDRQQELLRQAMDIIHPLTKQTYAITKSGPDMDVSHQLCGYCGAILGKSIECINPNCVRQKALKWIQMCYS